MANETVRYHVEFDVEGDISLMIHHLLTLGEAHWKVIGGADGVDIRARSLNGIAKFCPVCEKNVDWILREISEDFKHLECCECGHSQTVKRGNQDG